MLAICMKKKKPRVILRIFVNDVIQTKKVFWKEKKRKKVFIDFVHDAFSIATSSNGSEVFLDLGRTLVSQRDTQVKLQRYTESHDVKI